ncbi:MAG: hypothetical protein OEV01_11535 [Nitrospira sp.]|nr:hypothetical protein [Nitrospira sp.]MDH4304587.1 hypothetical protein [Nitrospira sp.]
MDRNDGHNRLDCLNEPCGDEIDRIRVTIQKLSGLVLRILMQRVASGQWGNGRRR